MANPFINALSMPEEMTEAERMQEIGRLLAAAIERMHKARPAIPDIVPENQLDSAGEESVYA